MDKKPETMELEPTTRHLDEVNTVGSQPADNPDPHDTYRVSTRTYLVVILMGLTWGTCTMANIGPSTTYSHAVSDLGGSSVSAWIPNAALFPLIGIQPIWGTLADRFGKRWFIVFGGLAGVTGNIVSGTAKSVETVIIGQAFSGLGASLFLLVVPASMEIVPAKHRSFAQGLMGLVNGALAIAVVLIAGAFSSMSSDGWRWVYYFNTIFFGSCALGILALYNPPPPRLRREHTTREIVKSIDVVGIFLLLAGVVTIVVALTWGGHTYPWSDSRVVAPLVVGAASLIAFGLYEAFGIEHGLIDHRFLASRNFLLILSVSFIDGMLLYGVNAFLPQEIGALFSSNPITVGVYLLPLNACVIVGILVGSYVLGVLKQYRLLLVSSVLLITLFCGLLALVTPSKLAMMLVFTGIIGLGVGVTTVLPPVILTYAIPSHLLGTAGTVLAAVRALGGVIGITIFATINSNYMKGHESGAIASAVIEAGLGEDLVQGFVTSFIAGDTASLAAMAGVTPSILAAAGDALKHVTAQSFEFVWIANAAFGALTAILTAFLQPVHHHMTAHVEAPLEDSKLRNETMQ